MDNDIIKNLQSIINESEKETISRLIYYCEVTDNIELSNMVKEKGLPKEIFISRDLKELVNIFNQFSKVSISEYTDNSGIWFWWDDTIDNPLKLNEHIVNERKKLFNNSQKSIK